MKLMVPVLDQSDHTLSAFHLARKRMHPTDMLTCLHVVPKLQEHSNTAKCLGPNVVNKLNSEVISKAETLSKTYQEQWSSYGEVGSFEFKIVQSHFEPYEEVIRACREMGTDLIFVS